MYASAYRGQDYTVFPCVIDEGKCGAISFEEEFLIMERPNTTGIGGTN